MSGADERSLKRFNGEEDDPGRQLRRWRAWAEAKMYTMDKLTNKQQGPFLYTLLDGKALEAVEHLELSSLQVEDGASKILAVLKERFPEKEAHDQMGEALGEVFGLAARENETVQQWTARVAEVFTKCHRKADVKFPSPAQGWIALNCAGFSEEQKAIIKAKAQGKLDLESVTSAMRSCSPLYKAGSKAKRPTTAFLAEPSEIDETIEAPEDFADVEAFLADHQLGSDPDESIPENEAAEALAATWKERRAEIARFKKDRKFDSAQHSKKSFRVEIEELKRRTRCRKCGRVGHWARECRSGGGKGGSSSSAASRPTASSTTGVVEAQLVEQEVSLAQYEVDPAEEPSDVMFVGMAQVAAQAGVPVLAAGLVSSPGFGVVDSGCGRTLIGKDTLQQLEAKIGSMIGKTLETYQATSSFRFGNGATEVSSMAVKIPVGIGGVPGIIDAAVIQGRAPLLLGRPTLEKLQVSLNFGNKTMRFLNAQEAVPMKVNDAGQLLIDILSYPSRMVAHKPVLPAADSVEASGCKNDVAQDVTCGLQPSLEGHVPPPPSPEPLGPLSPKTNKNKKPMKNKHCKCLLAQVKTLDAKQSAQVAVAELFSPPRLTEQARQHGATGLAFDIKQGCDLGCRSTQKEVDQLLEEARPALLTASPPCIHCGDWDSLHMIHRTPLERARMLMVSRQQFRFCAQQIQRQLARGGHFLLEHPVGSRIWKDPLIRPLVNKYGLVRVDMCAYGLTCPRSGLPIKRETALLCSNPNLAQGARTCPGCHRHQHIQGHASSGVSRSEFSGRYCSGFVEMLWRHVGFNACESLVVQGDPLDWTALECECLAGSVFQRAPEIPRQHEAPAANEQPEDPQEQQRLIKIDQALLKLHTNLGHPSNKELVRVLKHSGASDRAVQRASSLSCSVCANQSRPTAPLPANTSSASQFNEKVGLDVKYLPGWLSGQKIPCVNMVDFATSLQVMVPLHRTETGETTRDALRDRWVSWAGPPQTLCLDPSQPNLSQVLGAFCNNTGIDMRHTAADAHWQLGKVERHGQWLCRVFQRVLDESRPQSEPEWRDCLSHAQSAKNTLLTEAGASPYQLVFGRNPRVPTDLMQEAPHLGAVDAEQAEPALERAAAVRAASRRAMLECQSDRAVRAALRARPRALRPFRSGDWVYYWRTQKHVDGVRIEGGRWYGAGLVLGSVGRNFVVAHRRSLLRCAPEQLRFATPSEATVAEFPESELLGVKTLLEKGQFPKSQFVDVTQESRPPEAPEEAQATVDEPSQGLAGLNAAQWLEQHRQTAAGTESPKAPEVSCSAPGPTQNPTLQHFLKPAQRKNRHTPLSDASSAKLLRATSVSVDCPTLILKTSLK